ncbi:hypothetical protein LguiA_013691 [Lonicera macranthoides]
MNKVILSSPPSCSNCVAIAICGQLFRLSYCKCNDKDKQRKAPPDSILTPLYFVESSDGDLLMVSRDVDYDHGHFSRIV